MQGTRPRRLAMIAALAATIGVAAAGCGGRVQARTPGPTPPLAVPDPPSRLVIPVTLEIPPPPPAPPDKPAPTASPRPSPTRPAPTPTPSATPTPTPAETPTPVLQTTTSLADLEARALERLARAKKDLLRITPATLGRDAKGQFDSAERFIRMAEDAIAGKGFVYAYYCADKAAILAGLLVK
jgi:hypothetical protein